MPDWNVSTGEADQPTVILKLGKVSVELATTDAFELGWAIIDAAAHAAYDGEIGEFEE